VPNDLSTKAAAFAPGFVVRFAERLNGFAAFVGRQPVDVASIQQARSLAAWRSICARTVAQNPGEIHCLARSGRRGASCHAQSVRAN
jgi:hypothetical protein